jgi:ferric-dicitrate binding protein FerR (iron transport regulator)
MEDLNDILAKHFAGETNPQEEAKVLAWEETHGAEYDLLAKTWNEPVDLTFKSYDSKQAWNKISDELNEPKGKIFTLKRFTQLAVAASFAVLIGLTINWYFGAQEFILVNNDSHAAKEIKLEDGSTVWLGSNSSLEYAENFKSNRDIKLNGEAFFEVAKDPEHAFKIVTETGEVEVLGTGFNVESTSAYTEVSVSHGLVALRNGKDEVKLPAGKSARATKSEISEVTDAQANYAAWLNGEFTFDQAPLSEVILQLNTFYEKEIVLLSESAKTKSITATFKNQSLEEVIEIIKLTCGLEATFAADKVELK